MFAACMTKIVMMVFLGSGIVDTAENLAIGDYAERADMPHRRSLLE